MRRTTSTVGFNNESHTVRYTSDRGVRSRYTKSVFYDKKSNLLRVEESSRSVNIVSIVTLSLIVAGMLAFFQGIERTDITFLSFLNMLRDVPPVDLSFLQFPNVSISLPVWLDWLNSILNILTGIFNFLVFIVQGLTQAVFFLLYFLDWLF